MKSFALHSPTSAGAAVDLLSELPSAQVIAGGQTLLLEMKARQARPEHLVSVTGIPDLQGWRIDEDGSLDVGAAVPYVAVVTSDLPGWHASLAGAVGGIADRAVRNRGTLAGSLCSGEVRYDAPTLSVGSDASLEVMTATGLKTVPVLDFLVDRAAGRCAHDLVTRIRFPSTTRWRAFAFEKVSQRQFDSAVISVAVSLSVNDARAVSDARVVVGALAEIPTLASRVADQLLGLSIDDGTYEVLDEFVEEIVPLAPNASRIRRYQRALLPALLKKTVDRAFEQARSVA